MEDFPDIVEPEIILKVERIMQKKSPTDKFLCEIKHFIMENWIIILSIAVFLIFLSYRSYQVTHRKQIELEKERQLHYFLYTH